jgi:hypothetical protein
MTATLQFNDSPGQQQAGEALVEFMKFGTPVTIPAESITSLTVDAPAGLGGEFQGGTLTLDGTFRTGAEQAAVIVLRVPAQLPVCQMIRLSVTDRSAGPAGGLRLSARDPSGLLTLEQRFDMVQRTHQAHLTYQYHAGTLAKDAVPVLRFCAAVAAGTEMAITARPGTSSPQAPGPSAPPPGPRSTSAVQKRWRRSSSSPGPPSRSQARSPRKTSGTCTTPSPSCVVKMSGHSGAA